MKSPRRLLLACLFVFCLVWVGSQGVANLQGWLASQIGIRPVAFWVAPFAEEAWKNYAAFFTRPIIHVPVQLPMILAAALAYGISEQAHRDRLQLIIPAHLMFAALFWLSWRRWGFGAGYAGAVLAHMAWNRYWWP